MCGAQQIETKLREWDENTNINKMFTASDEAFSLLVLENYYDYWCEERKWRSENPGEKFQPDAELLKKICPKYNQRAEYINSKVGDVARFKLVAVKVPGGGGWTKEGIKRYNDLIAMVEEKRETEGNAYNHYFGRQLYTHSKERMGIDEKGQHKRCRKRAATTPLKEQPALERPKYTLPTFNTAGGNMAEI